MASNILQLMKELDEKQKNSLLTSNITQPQSVINPITTFESDEEVIEEPVIKPISPVLQLMNDIDERQIQNAIGSDTVSNSKIESENVKYKSTLADIDQTIPAIVKGITTGFMSLPQTIGQLMSKWAETEHLMANPSEFVGNPKWEGADQKMFEAMYTSRYKPVREIQTGIAKDVNKKGQEIVAQNREYVKRFALPGDASALNKFLFDLGAGASSLALSLGVSVITHNPMIGAYVFGSIAEGQAYEEAREAGVEPLKASALSTINKATETALEYVGLEFLLTRYPWSKPMSMILKGTSEGMQEFLQETSSNLVAKYGWDTTRKWNQGALRAGVLGFILGNAADVTIGAFVKEAKAPYNVTKKIIDKVYEDMENTTSNLNMDTVHSTLEDERMDYGGELPAPSEELGGTQQWGTQTAQILRGTKGMTADDIMQQYPNIQLKRDVNIRDIYGDMKTIKAGEALTPYELKGGKILLQDGETYLVSKGKSGVIMQNAASAVRQEFASELKGTTEQTFAHRDVLSQIDKKNEYGQMLIEKYDVTGRRGLEGVATNEEMAELNRLEDLVAQPVTKFEQYVEPGGTNYKEILIKAPTNLEGRGVIDYQSPHWQGIDNVLFHLRVNERTDVNGKKVLFVEEMQSDWAQGARKYEAQQKETGTLEDYKQSLLKKYNKTSMVGYTNWISEEDRTKLHSLLDLSLPFAEKVPTHPLLKQWTELSVKRALQEAVNSGAEFLSWTTGKQQADRYSLATKIDKITWKPTPMSIVEEGIVNTSNSHQIVLVLPNGNEIYLYAYKDGYIAAGTGEGENFKGKNLNEVIPKELASKILGVPKGELKGEGLEIGGEWAKNLYDKQIKNIIEKLTGQKLTTVNMNMAETEREHALGWEKNVYNQAIKLTPSVIAKVKGIAPEIKVSGQKFAAEAQPTITFAGEEVGGTAEGVITETALGKAIPAKRITVGEHPGILITPAQFKKRMAQAEKALHDNKVRDLIDAMGDKGKLPPNITNQVKQEYDNFWTKGSNLFKTYVANNRLVENILGMLDNFKSYGTNWKALYGGINDGMNQVTITSNKAVEDLRKFLQPLFTNKQIARLITDRTHNISRGRFALTDGAVVGVYMSSRNKNNLRHLKGMGFTDGDIKQCIDIYNTSPNLKAISTFLDAKYEEVYKRLAKAVMKAEGRILSKEEFFSHIAIDKETLVFEKDNIVEQMRSRKKTMATPYVEKGITKERTHSSRPMHLDAIANYLRYSADAEFYIGMADKIADASKILKDTKYRVAIEQKAGKPTLAVLDKYLRDVSGTKVGINIDGVDKAFTFLRRHTGVSMIGMNILSALRQPLSASQAAAEIGLSHVLNGIQQVVSNPVEVMKMVYELSPTTKYRAGQFERFMSEEKAAETIPQVITGKKTLPQTFMTPVSFMDKWTVIAVWKGTYDRVIATGKTIGGERIDNATLQETAIMEADRVIRHTQPFTGAKDLPGYHRGSILSLMLTQFQNQVNKNINYFDYDIIGKYKAGKIGAGTAAYRVLFAYVLPAMLMGMISRGRLPKEPKEVIEDLAKYPLAGAFLVGSLVNNAIDNYGDYGPPAFQPIVDVGIGLKALWDFEWERGGKYGIKATAEILGIPYSQAYRTYSGLKALMEGRTDDWKRIIWSEYVLNKGKAVGSRVGRSGRATR